MQPDRIWNQARHQQARTTAKPVGWHGAVGEQPIRVLMLEDYACKTCGFHVHAPTCGQPAPDQRKPDGTVEWSQALTWMRAGRQARLVSAPNAPFRMESPNTPFEIIRWGGPVQPSGCTTGQFIDAFGDEKRFRFTLVPQDAP